MILNSSEWDALNELINIGFGRAASALSLLVDQRILIEAPHSELLPLDTLPAVLGSLEGELINVHQIFRGRLSGDAMLLMDKDSATILVDMLEGGDGNPRQLSAADREVLVETGNILLNAFIGSFGNLLKVHLTFTVPHFNLSSLRELIMTLSTDNSEAEYALIVKIRFRLTQGDVSGYVMIVMGIQSLNILLNAMRTEGYLI
jgi:chemotaxis protein CheC